MFNKNQFPPDWELARNHALSVQPGFITPPHHPEERTNAQPLRVCPCCMNVVKPYKVRYCENDKELFFLGEGFPLYYSFIKMCMIMLVLLVLDSSIINLFINYNTNVCTGELGAEASKNIVIVPEGKVLGTSTSSKSKHPLHFSHMSASAKQAAKSSESHCDNNIWTRLAFISTQKPKRKDLQYYQTIIKCTSFAGQILILIYLKYSLNQQASYLNQENITPSDYSIYVSHLPRGNPDVQQRLRKLVTNNNPGVQVARVLVIHDLDDYYQLENQLDDKLADVLKKLKKQRRPLASQQLGELQQEIAEDDESLQKLGQSIKKREAQTFSGRAIITVQTEDQRIRVSDYLESKPDTDIQKEFPNFDRNIHPVKVRKCADPSEINWQHAHVETWPRIRSVVLSWLLTLFSLFIIVMGFFFLIKYKANMLEEAYENYSQDREKYGREYRRAITLGIFIVVMINIFNKFVYTEICHYFTHKQRQNLHYHLQHSFALKYALGMFFTTALMTLVVEAIIKENYVGPLGAVEEESFMFVFNALFSPLAMLINPYYITYWVRRKMRQGSLLMTQAQANALLTKPPYDIGKRYAQIIKTMWFTFLYSSLIPIGPIFSLMGLLAYYHLDRYTLLYRSTVHGNITRGLEDKMFTLLQLTLVFKPLGEVIFDFKLRGNVNTESWVLLAVGVLFVLVPLNSILTMFFPEQFNTAEQKYSEVSRQYFNDLYELHYPINRPKECEEFIKEKKDMVLLKQKTYRQQSETT